MVVLSNIACPSLQGHKSLFCDYFAKTLVDPYKYFRMRFQMSHSLIYIQSMVDTHKPYFVQGIYGSKRFSFSSLQKVIAALMMLTYGVTIDFIDEYLKIGKTTAIKSLKMFVKVLVSFIFIFIFWRVLKVTQLDIAILLIVSKNQGFLSMLGSIDCMHWKWKNAWLRGNVCVMVISMNQLLFWK